MRYAINALGIAVVLIALPCLSAVAQPGNGFILNSDNTNATIAVRASGATDEKPFTLAPWGKLRLRNHSRYEVFIPSSGTVYDLNVKGASGAGGWQQNYYYLFQDGGKWALGRGLPSELKGQTSAVATQTEAGLQAKWNLEQRRPEGGNGQTLNEQQLLYCKAFALEDFIRARIELPIAIHPKMDYLSGQKQVTVTIEAFSCAAVSPELARSVHDLVAKGMGASKGNVKIIGSCCDDSVEVTWEEFVEICKATNRTVKPGSAGNGFDTGTYFGIDGTGSWLDEAAEQYARIQGVSQNPALAPLAPMRAKIEQAIKSLVCLGSSEDPLDVASRNRTNDRIEALYGCQALNQLPGKLGSIVVDRKKLINSYIIDKDGLKVTRTKTYTVSVNRRLPVTNVQIQLDGFQSIEFRPRGFCIAETKAKERGRNVTFESKWVDLPVGQVDAFRKNASYCVRVKNGSTVKVYDLQPNANRKYLIGASGIMSSKLPVTPQP